MDKKGDSGNRYAPGKEPPVTVRAGQKTPGKMSPKTDDIDRAHDRFSNIRRTI